jgi:predicted nucleic acid-binding protein
VGSLAPGGVADTSFFIALEAGRPVDLAHAPERVAVSVVTVAELRSGVLQAVDEATRRRRQATLDSALGSTVLDVDDDIGQAWADMRAHLTSARRRVRVNDLWIAATAAVHHLPVVTQDDDFELVAGVRGLEVIRV